MKVNTTFEFAKADRQMVGGDHPATHAEMEAWVHNAVVAALQDAWDAQPAPLSDTELKEHAAQLAARPLQIGRVLHGQAAISAFAPSSGPTREEQDA